MAVILNLTAMPSYSLDYPHTDVNNISCDSCHYVYGGEPSLLPPWTTHVSQDIDDTQYNTLCWSCHNDIEAPYMRTHSSLQIDDDYGSWTVECRTCHDPHSQEQLKTHTSASFLYSGTSTDLTATTLTETGAGWTDDEHEGRVLIPNVDRASRYKYGYKIIGNSSDTITVEGPVNLERASAGDTFAIIYGKLIKSIITTDNIINPLFPKSGDKTVRFFTDSGTNSYADGNSTYDGVCEVCHTETSYHQNDGGGIIHNTGLDCMQCHNHIRGFAHGGGGGTSSDCEECHGHDPGYGGFTGGKGSYVSHSTHTENDSDDLRGPNVGCAACHDTTSMPYFNSGADSNGDGRIVLSETDVCDTCHSPGGTYNGVNGAVVGAKNNWTGAGITTSPIYAADGSLQPGKDRWCATCHDEAPSQISGIDAPNIVGDESGAYTYGTGWGYYKTGHGLDSGNTYPSSGGLVPGAGKTCGNCHDFTLTHIDGLARTFDCDSYDDGDDTNDGCSSTEYRQSYRLKLVDGADPLNIPRPVLSNDFINEDDFRLCLQVGCHTPEKFIDTDIMTTNFRDETGGYYANAGGIYPFNTHAYHLRANETSRYYPDWRVDTGVNGESQTTCVTCHNVHGSDQLSMVRNGSLNGKADGLIVYYNDGVEALGPSGTTLNNSTATAFYPASTANLCESCHVLASYAKWDRTPAAQVVPTLAWTGEVGYIVDGVNPDSGPGGSSFAFRVEYTDASSEAPKYIQVWIDENDNSSYEEGEKYDMAAVDPADTDYSDGKLYKKTISIAYAGDGDLAYRFYARDVMYEATGGPVSDSIVGVTNRVPTLAWTGEAGYPDDGVNPNSGGAGSNFQFRVKYTDADNECPLNADDIQVVVNGTSYDLDNNDGAACSAGRTYYTTIPLSSVGSLNYHFGATDGTDSATGDPTTDKVVQVTDNTNSPVLSWTGETGYASDGVNPDTGSGCIGLEFRVEYTDMDNQCPASGSSDIQVWIDEDDNGYDGDEKFNMTEADAGDTDCTDSKIYTVSRTLSTAGSHNYRFRANDGTQDAATGGPVSGSTVTIADALEVPSEYTAIQDAVDAASNGDYVCVSDGTYSEQINFSNKAITVKSFNGAASTIINGSGGNTSVVVINSGEGSDSILDGFTIDNQAGNRGIVIEDSSPTIRNSTIQGNTAGNSYGGGIYISGGGASIENCVMGTEDYPNTAAYGGGLSFQDSVTDTLTIKDSTIRYNTAAWNGGGLDLLNDTNTTIIENTTISNNAATNRYGGGIRAGNAPLTIISSYIDNNSSGWGGSGLYLSGDDLTTTTLENSTVSGNSCGWCSGGGIYFTGSNSTLAFNNSTIADNTSSPFSGGGLIAGGTSQTITVDNSTFSGNSGREGGGIYFGGSGSTLAIRDSEIISNIGFFGPGGLRLAGGEASNTVTVERTVIAGNHAQGTAGYGGGVRVSTSSDPQTYIETTFENCMVTGNNSLMNGGGFYAGGAGATVNIANSTLSGNIARHGGGIYNASAILSVNNSILWGNSHRWFPEPTPEIGGSGTTEITNTNIRQSGYEGNGNMNVDPLFIDQRDYSDAPTAEGDYHLNVDSPVIDIVAEGDGVLVLDIDGDVRPQGAGYDIGADEVLNQLSTNNVPALLWSGETDYTTDGVDPDTAPDGSSFEFRVSYLDADNSAPGDIELWVDEDDSGDYDPGEMYNMTETDADDTDHTDGKIYTKTLSLSKPADGTLNYRFYATDGSAEAIGAPATDNTVTVNTIPTLAWTGEVNYSIDGVDPDSASKGSSFTFRIDYIESENEAPTAVQVWIDEDDSGTYESGEKHDMTETDGGDTDYTDGKRYTKTLAISYAGDGGLNYRFHASDGISDASGDPTSDSTVTVEP